MLSCHHNPHSQHRFILNNHLRNSLPTQRLTALKLLSLDTRQDIKQRCEQQHDRGGNQAGRLGDNREPLDDGHDAVDCGAHVVRFEAADEGVEFGGCWADSEEERDFDEDYDEGADTGIGMLEGY